ncbi:MAG TPA: hypothetical protein VNJ05_03765 [Sphingomicrobium sp.]|nr:hypothetical protein [Sphingomicrobium sp.]
MSIAIALLASATPASAENWVKVDNGWVIDTDSLVRDGSWVYYDERVSAGMEPTQKHRVNCSQDLSSDFVVETRDGRLSGGRWVYDGPWSSSTIPSYAMSANVARYACANA